MDTYAERLLQAAKTAQKQAYAPYSGFQVGAALLLADGEIVNGCNVENASYGATVCAERVAVWSAVAAGKLSLQNPPQALAVTALPCALCLQVLSEFAGPDLPVLVAADDGAESGYQLFYLGDLLPQVFRLK
ncbi:MAG: cytidine deaminase [Firmicutes bacterium]|nr:cytidine deaminase [Bacillota bacterium]